MPPPVLWLLSLGVYLVVFDIYGTWVSHARVFGIALLSTLLFTVFAVKIFDGCCDVRDDWAEVIPFFSALFFGPVLGLFSGAALVHGAKVRGTAPGASCVVASVGTAAYYYFTFAANLAPRQEFKCELARHGPILLWCAALLLAGVCLITRASRRDVDTA